MKLNNLWKAILIVLIIMLLFLFSITFVRKICILNNLKEKIATLNDNNNIYVKIEHNSTVIERYKKDKIEKNIINYKDKNTTYTEIIKDNLRTVYIDSNTEKSVATYDASNFVSSQMILDYTYFTNIYEKILFSIQTNITIQNIEGKICYAIQEKTNPNMFVSENCTNDILYVEKETGMPVKRIIKYGDKQEEIYFKYKFGVVSDEDLVLPDINQYERKN